MSTANGALLSVEAVTKSFEGLRAVNECSLDVKRGTITGLIGPNGAGKTTLFNIVTGFLKPTSGRIVFNGNRVDGLPPHKVFSRGIVRTFQIPRELKQMTVLENLMLVPAGQSGERLWNPWLLPFRVRRQEREIRDKALEVLEFVNLWHLRNDYASNISSGQKQLLTIARAFLADPSILILDEATSNVDTRTELYVQEAMARLRQGRTSFVIAHRLSTIRNADTIVVMDGGRIVEQGDHAELLERHGLYHTLYTTQFARTEAQAV